MSIDFIDVLFYRYIFEIRGLWCTHRHTHTHTGDQIHVRHVLLQTPINKYAFNYESINKQQDKNKNDNNGKTQTGAIGI